MKPENETKRNETSINTVHAHNHPMLSLQKNFRNLTWFLKLRGNVNFPSTWECDLTKAPLPGMAADKCITSVFPCRNVKRLLKTKPQKKKRCSEVRCSTSGFSSWKVELLKQRKTKVKTKQAHVQTFPTDKVQFSSG